MSRWMNGNGNDRTGRDRSRGLVRGVLDFELDIGIVGDVDPDPLKFGRGRQLGFGAGNGTAYGFGLNGGEGENKVEATLRSLAKARASSESLSRETSSHESERDSLRESATSWPRDSSPDSSTSNLRLAKQQTPDAASAIATNSKSNVLGSARDFGSTNGTHRSDDDDSHDSEYEAELAQDILEHRAFALDPANWISIQGSEHGQALFIGLQRVSLPKEWRNPDFPFVRAMPDGNILVSDTTFDVSHEKNTWILNRKGDVLAHFGVGSAAVEISPLEGGLIAVAYHPMSARRFGHRVEPQQRTAIAFFDRQGKLLTTFNHEAGRSNIAAENVRCMTRISQFELVFIPEKLTSHGQEVENPVVFYHCATGRTVVFSAPFGGAEAVSVARGPAGESWLLLASPEGFEDQVIAFDPARKMSQYLGAFNGIFRGLANDAGESLWGRTISSGLLSGGFLAQEIVSEYNWILADSNALPSTFKSPTAERFEDDQDGPDNGPGL